MKHFNFREKSHRLPHGREGWRQDRPRSIFARLPCVEHSVQVSEWLKIQQPFERSRRRREIEGGASFWEWKIRVT